MASLETRTIAAQFEIRDDNATGVPVLHGYATTFGTTYDLGMFKERVNRSAFDRTLSNGPDVRLLIDHEGQPLARTRSGTLTLTPDDKGLQVHAPLDPSDPDVQRLLPKMRRGDLDQMSFAFRVPDGGDSWSEDFSLRDLNEINLSGGDVSVVTYPANPDTTVSVRAKDRREAAYVFADRILRELRADKPVDAPNMSKLRAALDALATADVHLHAAHGHLGTVTGQNPDEPDPDEPADDDKPPAPAAKPARSLETALRIAAALDL
jgi:HK97 family phage prohead protease